MESGRSALEWRSRPTREKRLDALLGAIVVGVAAVAQLWLLLGPQPYDPAYYFQTAANFPIAASDYWTLRIGLMTPVWLTHLLFGPSEAALYGIPLLTGLLLAGAVYWTMLLLFGDRVQAAAAAFVTVLSTSWLLNSSFIFPDTAAAATFAAGFLCLVIGRSRAAERDESWVTTVAALVAGVFLGWTYLIREFSPILLPAVIVAVVLLRYPLRRLALIAGAALATFSVELLYGLVGYGDPLVRAEILLDRRDAEIRPARAHLMERIEEQLNDPLDTILVFPRLLLTWNTGWLFLVLLAVFVVGLVRFRDWRLWILAGWCFSFWAVMAGFGLWRLPSGELIVNVTNIRYWYPMLPPLVMGAFGSLELFLQAFVRNGRRSFVTLAGLAATPAVAALVLIPGTAEFRSCAAKNIWRNEPARRWHELRSWLGTPAAQRYDVIWTDVYSTRLVPAYSSETFGHRLWRGQVETIAPYGRVIVPTSHLRRSLILVHKRFLPRGAKRLRSDWSPIFESSDRWMVLLAHSRAASSGAPAAGEHWWLRSPRRHADLGECGLSPYEPR